jgi:hypothetical protein
LEQAERRPHRKLDGLLKPQLTMAEEVDAKEYRSISTIGLDSNKNG